MTHSAFFLAHPKTPITKPRYEAKVQIFTYLQRLTSHIFMRTSNLMSADQRRLWPWSQKHFGAVDLQHRRRWPNAFEKGAEGPGASDTSDAVSSPKAAAKMFVVADCVGPKHSATFQLTEHAGLTR